MTAQSTVATDAARRLWARAVGDTTAPEDVAAAAERMCTQVRTGLRRWIGADGYRALLNRALGLARAEHPALGDLPCLGGDVPGTTAVVRAQGAGAVAAGLVAVGAALIALVGRILGGEIAL